MKAQKSIEIAAPAHKIWPFLTEPEKIMEWCITFRKFEYTTNQQSGEGTPIYIEEAAGGPLMKMHFVITDCLEDAKIALKMVSGTGVKSYEQSWSIEPIRLGSRFTFMEEIELPYGVFGKLLSPLLERMSSGTIDKMLTKLKVLAEA